jgi:eukaryotic-like serine/threonine-protein kinase
MHPVKAAAPPHLQAPIMRILSFGNSEKSAPSEVLASEATQPIRIVYGVAVTGQPGADEPWCCLGEFEVLAEIARGGMGGVFLARDRRTHHRVALKLLEPQFAVHPDIVARMYDEFDVSRRARHPGLLEIHAFGRSMEGIPYLVMEYLDGENLGALLDRGRLELGAVAAIGAQVASAVSSLHFAGVVHCDLKPDNIHVLYEAGTAGWPRTKVLDFGVAKILDAVIDDEPSIAGTPAYMAPEQWRGGARQ